MRKAEKSRNDPKEYLLCESRARRFGQEQHVRDDAERVDETFPAGGRASVPLLFTHLFLRALFNM